LKKLEAEVDILKEGKEKVDGDQKEVLSAQE
jgi:hypothetical protein